TASTAIGPFAIQVRGPDNRAPTISGSPATSVQATRAYSFTPSASDADNDRLTYSIVNRPTWASFSTSTGRLSGTPSSSQVGTYANIIITVSDGRATFFRCWSSIVVHAAPNRSPTFSGSTAMRVKSVCTFSFRPTASDLDD